MCSRSFVIALILLLFSALTVHANQPPEVTNVRAVQRPDTTLVDITYDLTDADGDTLYVTVEIFDSVRSDTIREAVTFSGDLGAGILSGRGKRIVWDVGKYLPNTFQKFVALVTVTDGLLPSFSGGTLPDGVKMEFVFIQPGTFLMGSPESEAGRYSNEGPQHQVTISQGFYLSKYEVTQGQWEAVMSTTPWSGQSEVQSNPDHPAVYVDAQAFIQKLNQEAGTEVYRLPTEAEGEYACRAGTTTRWSFGDDRNRLGDYAWYDGNAWSVGNRHGHKVGSKLPNPWGLYDMHGNVWEWCQDWWSTYPSDAQIDPTGPSAGSPRVSRGGNFSGIPPYVRSAIRLLNAPSLSHVTIGFRVVRRAQ